MGSQINRRFGAVGVRRGRLIQKAGTVAAAEYWDQLFNAAATDTPITLYYADASFLTLVSGEVSGWADAWAGGAAAHNLTQTTAARRPHWTLATPSVDFDRSSVEWMTAGYGTGEAASDRTHIVVANVQSILVGVGGNGQFWQDWQTGRISLHLQNNTPTNKRGWYDGTLYEDVAPVTGLQSWVFEHAIGTGTAKLRVDGSLVFTSNLASIALGGTAIVGNIYSGGSANTLDANVTCMGHYSGVADYAAIETVLASIKASL